MKTLWVLFIASQILSAGHMNYQQEAGYYEINPIYGKHPSKEQVYITKGLEIGAIYGLTKVLPRHEKTILRLSTTVCWGFIISDKTKGIKVEFRW